MSRTAVIRFTHTDPTDRTSQATSEIAEPEICSICYEPMESVNFCVTECNHRFHTSCLIQTMNFNPNCPFCRRCLNKKTDSTLQTHTHTHTDSDIPQNIAEELRMRSESRRRQQNVLNQALRNIGVIDITASEILIEQEDEDEEEDLYFEPVRSRLVERTNRNCNCSICGQNGHNRRNCIFRGSFV